MKVKLYIENSNWIDDNCCVEADFFSAPRVGEYVSSDWDSVKDAIIEADRVKDFLEYLQGHSQEWYANTESRGTMAKPSKEQIKEDLNFDGIGKVLAVRWVVEHGKATCRAWVGEM